VRDLPLGAVMRSALVGGIAGALAAGLFHFLLTEPLLDRAVAVETLRHMAEGTYQEPVVGRDAQRVGLFVGFLLYGLSWSLLFGAAYHLSQRWLPAWGAVKRGLLVALVGFWAVALFPALKYPANPPGVGDPDTIGYRQALYLGLLALSVAGAVLAGVLARRLDRGWWPAVVFGLAYAAVVYLALPSNPDATTAPPEVVTAFRGLSVAGLLVFWLTLGLVFGLLLRREDGQGAPAGRRRPAPERA
jgi:predicted cobalt transporter CbtA